MSNLLKKTTLGQQIAAILRENIIKGTYAQGEHLIEEELARKFEVSRATIREALRLLETEGLLDREINKCTYVHRLSAKEIKGLFSMRILLEREAISRCVENQCIPSDVILNCIDRMKFCMENGSNDWDAHLQADMAFHTSVINANDNIYIRKCWELIASQYKMAMYIIRALYARAFLGTYQEHQRIYEQLMEGNTQPWIAHLENLKADVDKIIREGNIGN